MLGIFRTNQLSTSILFLLYLAVLRAPHLAFPSLRQVQDWQGGIFGYWANDWLKDNFWWNEGIIAGILFLSAVIVCQMVLNHRLGRDITLFSGLFYLLVCSSNPSFFSNGCIHAANMFLLFALWEIFKTYRTPSCADTIFNIGLWIGVASLFYISYAVFLVWGIIGLNLLRAFRFKEVLMILVGFMTPYIILLACLFWWDNLDIFYTIHLSENVALLDLAGIDSVVSYIPFATVLLLFIIVVINYRQYIIKQNIQVQRKISVLFWLLFIGLFSVLWQADVSGAHALVLALPVGVLISFNFVNMSSQWADVVHFLWFLAALLIQFLPFL